MHTEILKYSNNLNQVRLGKLSVVEQNLMFKLIYKIQQQGNLAPIEITAAEIAGFTPEHHTSRELAEICESLNTRFLDLKVISAIHSVIDGVEFIEEERIHLFQALKIKRKKETGALVSITVTPGPHFEQVVIAIQGNFTLMELGEFLSIDSKYTKIIFRLLCRFRSTGKAIFKWEEFKKQLEIPDSYRMYDIDRQILKPAIKELSWETEDKGPDLIKQSETKNAHPCFRNLQFRKIKKGRAIELIEFSWDVPPGKRIIESDASPVSGDENLDPEVLELAKKLAEKNSISTTESFMPATHDEQRVETQPVQNQPQAQLQPWPDRPAMPWESRLPSAEEQSKGDHPATPEELKQIFGDKYKEGEHPLSFVVDLFRPQYKNSGEGSDGSESK